MTPHELASASPQQVRTACRTGTFDGPTAGLAPGFAQANLVVLPADLADDFRQFCANNPKPCPVLEITKPGSPEPVRFAPGADLRTDLPRYRMFEHGVCVARTTSVEDHWPIGADLVAFLLGCSFTFERALIDAGVPVRHIEENRNVPMYRTNIECEPSEVFSGPLVVSMRPMTREHAKSATTITARFARVHGAPVHVGRPGEQHSRDLGIPDLSAPDYGDAVTIHPDEVPVFWACGVTPMEAIARAQPAFAITHEPGHMFITDVRDSKLRDPGA